MTLDHKMLRSLGDASEESRTLVQRARKVLHGTVAIFYLAFHRISNITKGLIISDPYPNKVTHVRDGTLKVGAKLRVAGVVLNLRRLSGLRHPPLAFDKTGFLKYIKAHMRNLRRKAQLTCILAAVLLILATGYASA